MGAAFSLDKTCNDVLIHFASFLTPKEQSMLATLCKKLGRKGASLTQRELRYIGLNAKRQRLGPPPLISLMNLSAKIKVDDASEDEKKVLQSYFNKNHLY